MTPKPVDEEIKYVKCPECGTEQVDIGRNMSCEECDHWPMPYHDEHGRLIEA